MFEALINRKIEGYLKQANVVGDMRNALLSAVWWTREAAVLSPNGMDTAASVSRLLKLNIAIGDIYTAYYSDESVGRLQQLLGGFLGALAEISRGGTPVWGPSEVASFLASVNQNYSIVELERLFRQLLELTKQEVHYIRGGRFTEGVEFVEKLLKAGLELADYLAVNLIKQFK